MFSRPEGNISFGDVYPGQTVVDLGAGAGFHSLLLAEVVGPAGKVYATDIQQDLLNRLAKEATKRNLKNLSFIWCDLEEPKGSGLADNLADRAFVTNVFFQIENKKSFASEAVRILKPKGKLIFVDWSDSFGGLGPKPEDVISEKDARKFFEEEGLEFEKKFPSGDHHYGLIFKKP